MDRLTISPFSPASLLLAAAIVLFAFAMRKQFLHKERAVRLRFMEIYSYVVFLCWLLYKAFLFVDPAFDAVFWTELPFHLCNISILLTPIACRKDHKITQSFIFFEGSIGALMAILMPPAGFEVAKLFSGCGLGYYGTHFLVLSLGLMFVALDIYEPAFPDIVPALVTFVTIGMGAHILNVIMRFTVCQDANYFYTFCLPENPILFKLYTLIPIPYVFELPLTLAFLVVNILMAIPFELHRQRAAKAAGQPV